MSEATKPTGYEAIGKVCTAILFGLPASVLRAWVLTKLWAWFVVPASNYGPITIASAFGALLVLSLFREAKTDDKTLLSDKIGISVIGSLMILSFGWLGTFLP